jgi:hypothetical protein
MKTAGDIQFEPTAEGPVAVGKIIPLTTSIAAMTAGDSAFQAEMMIELKALVFKRVETDPNTWWSVQDVVDTYISIYNKKRRHRINDTVLSPFGLDDISFIARQSQMSEYFVRNISNQITNFEMPEVATIITGIDDGGPHIYQLYGGEASCSDSVAFACIGSGARHANSQFMAVGHHRELSFTATLILTFVAKKRAEVAPGVGKQTDMFIAGPTKGSLTYLPPILEMERLEAFFKGLQKGELTAFEKAKKEMNKYVAEIVAQRKAAQQQTQASPPAKEEPPAPPANESDQPS